MSKGMTARACSRTSVVVRTELGKEQRKVRTDTAETQLQEMHADSRKKNNNRQDKKQLDVEDLKE